MEDVVDIRGDDQPLDRQAHSRGDVPCEDVAEIPRRHAEGELAVGTAQLQRGGEVVDNLCHQPRPVYRIDRADAVPCRNALVGEDALHHRLRVVEAAFDGDIVDVGRTHRGHLAALDVANPALGVEHEDLDIVATCDGVDGGAARIPAGRADDGQTALLASEELFEQQAEQLERDILEGERRAVEQF